MSKFHDLPTEQFIADFYARADRLESRRLKLYRSALILTALVPLLFVFHVAFSHNSKEESHFRPYSPLDVALDSPLRKSYSWQRYSYGSAVTIPVPAPETPTDITIEEPLRRFPGDPNPTVTGKAYWGAAISGNGDPKRHEETSDASLSIRRTFWQWKDGANLDSSMYKTVEDDLKSDRLPFISVKTPGWSVVANGKYDDDLDAMLKKLDSYGQPVWFVVHHEPEGGGGRNAPDDDGGAAAWRAMQSHVRDRMNALETKNIAFMPVLMSYTWNPASGRNPEDWWVPGIWDAYIVDHYHDSEKGDMFSGNQWGNFVTWIEDKGLPYGTAEWGNRGTDKEAAEDMQAFWNWSFDNKKDVIAYTYFDSGLNSPSGSWELNGQPLEAFQDTLTNDPRVQRLSDL